MYFSADVQNIEVEISPHESAAQQDNQVASGKAVACVECDRVVFHYNILAH